MAISNDDLVDEKRDDKKTEMGRPLNLTFLYRNQLLHISVPPHATLLQVGEELVSASGVAPHTLRLLLPHAPALLPFSNAHSSLHVVESGISEGRPVRMMGALPGEIKEVSQEAGSLYEKTIRGFTDEDQRAKSWRSVGARAPRKLPRGNYTFHDFRTLQLPGVELHPPASKAMEIMHRLASDPGIVAIMNKHRWSVGVMTEMAPVGYVGITSECILGYNKNKGEEISLRLRTDDLKGFRKYGSIKKTLLHELAHMVHSDHDANFHALDKQLNEEAISLDWTKSRGHTLRGSKLDSDDEEEDVSTDAGGVIGGQRLGGSKETSQLGARSAAAQAAMSRLSGNIVQAQIRDANALEIDVIAEGNEAGDQRREEPDPDDNGSRFEPDPDEAQGVDHAVVAGNKEQLDADYQDSKSQLEPDEAQNMEVDEASTEAYSSSNLGSSGSNAEAYIPVEISAAATQLGSTKELGREISETALEDLGLESMQEYTDMVCQRLHSAIAKLKEEATPSEAAATIQTLFKILRNLKEHPQEAKFKCLRKMNAAFQNRIARFKGAMEVLRAVGFDDGPCDGGDGMDCLILKRDDPVLLWLAQTSLEAEWVCT